MHNKNDESQIVQIGDLELDLNKTDNVKLKRILVRRGLPQADFQYWDRDYDDYDRYSEYSKYSECMLF